MEKQHSILYSTAAFLLPALFALIISTALVTLAFCAPPRYQNEAVDDVTAQAQPCYPDGNKDEQGTQMEGLPVVTLGKVLLSIHNTRVNFLNRTLKDASAMYVVRALHCPHAGFGTCVMLQDIRITLI